MMWFKIDSTQVQRNKKKQFIYKNINKLTKYYARQSEKFTHTIYMNRQSENYIIHKRLLPTNPQP